MVADLQEVAVSIQLHDAVDLLHDPRSGHPHVDAVLDQQPGPAEEVACRPLCGQPRCTGSRRAADDEERGRAGSRPCRVGDGTSISGGGLPPLVARLGCEPWRARPRLTSAPGPSRTCSPCPMMGSATSWWRDGCW